ncbi:MAG TPA: hypothetical protein VFP89_11500 [Propionibacteriaceae bacterium]|nr:hypothetical protein [Propionibacteriaceae bacterium]
MTTVRSHQELRTEAVNVLTRAAQRSMSHTAPLDFAGFLAEVLAATAANVGGPDLLLAARPGSWEASHVDALLRGTMGDDPNNWLPLRTEPLAISLNVAELIESGDMHPGLLGLDAAADKVSARYESAVEDQTLDAWDAEIDALTNRYADEYRRYADRFTVAARAAARIRGLSVDIVVTVDADPASAWRRESKVTNPSALTDGLELAIWLQAHDCVTLPNVEIGSVTNEQLTLGRG